MRKPISFVLIFSMLSMTIAPAAFAQEIGGSSTEETGVVPDLQLSEGSWMECHMQGEKDARSTSTSGSSAAGLASGLLLGLIGTGIAVLAQSKSDPSDEVMMSLEDASDECQYAYLTAFQDESVSKKRKSALTGGLIGTAILIGIYFATGGDQ